MTICCEHGLLYAFEQQPVPDGVRTLLNRVQKVGSAYISGLFPVGSFLVNSIKNAYSSTSVVSAATFMGDPPEGDANGLGLLEGRRFGDFRGPGHS